MVGSRSGRGSHRTDNGTQVLPDRHGRAADRIVVVRPDPVFGKLRLLGKERKERLPINRAFFLEFYKASGYCCLRPRACKGSGALRGARPSPAKGREGASRRSTYRGATVSGC